MVKLKSVAAAVVVLAASVGAHADTYALGPNPSYTYNSTLPLNAAKNLVVVGGVSGAVGSFADSWTFTTSSSTTISVALHNDAYDYGIDSPNGPAQGFEGAITGFAAMIDGVPRTLNLSGPVPGVDYPYNINSLHLGLSQTFQLGAGAHTIYISGTTTAADVTFYYGTVTLSAPVPEPETYAMMLAGLGAAALMARRRRND